MEFKTMIKNWSFPGLSEPNLYVFGTRAFPPKLAKSAQGFPNLENNSQGPTQLHSFKSTWEFTVPSLFTLHPNILLT
jgi:hypothetical protein